MVLGGVMARGRSKASKPEATPDDSDGDIVTLELTAGKECPNLPNVGRNRIKGQHGQPPAEITDEIRQIVRERAALGDAWPEIAKWTPYCSWTLQRHCHDEFKEGRAMMARGVTGRLLKLAMGRLDELPLSDEWKPDHILKAMLGVIDRLDPDMRRKLEIEHTHRSVLVVPPQKSIEHGDWGPIVEAEIIEGESDGGDT